ncbi:hypothetical protein [Sinorhizobium meliloti]|uniref:hypothetical protein n=1 Tax=Rhizobium meliloti TaxID=382 RepID=UPI000FDB418E|nr:hypothetical protein [Sinorhizobium meliloti]RVO54943.1 hypothetical protein CN092_18010 [Sinorhizobium meliloti]
MDDSENLTLGDLLPTEGCYLWSDDPEKTVYIFRDGDVMGFRTHWKSLSALFDANAAEAAAFSRTGTHGDIQKIASIPKPVFYDWRDQGITDDPDALRRRLNDGDFSKFRTNDWRL